MRVPPVLQQPRPRHLAGDEEEDPIGAVRVPKAGYFQKCTKPYNFPTLFDFFVYLRVGEGFQGRQGPYPRHA